MRTLIESTDPRRRAARLAASGIVDADLYAAQLGVKHLTVADAASHYATTGFRDGLTVNVLLDPFVLRRSLIRTDRPVIYDYLNSQAWHAATSGVWSSRRYLEDHPDAAEHPAGPVGHLWERVRKDSSTRIEIDPGGTRELAWSEIYPVLRDATVEWAALRRDRASRYPRPTLDHPARSPRVELDHEPLVSVVLPVWNRPAGLRRAISSVQQQEWTNWELLIVDDGSWDDSLTIAELAAARDARIRILAREHAGVCAARNAAIELAGGQFVAFLDSDNTWEPGFLRDVVSGMIERQVASAYATIALVSEAGTSYRHGAASFDRLLQGNSIDLNTLVVHIDELRAVGGFDESLRRAVDYDLVLKLAARHEIAHIPTLGATYDNREQAPDRISTTEPLGWNTAVRLRHSALPKRDSWSSGASVVALVHKHDPNLAERLLAVCETGPSPLSAQVVAIGVKPDEWRQIRAAAAGRDWVETILHQDGEPYAYVVNVAAARADREALVVIDPLARITREHIDSLAAAAITADTAAVIPIGVGPDGTIESAGSGWVGATRRAVRMLYQHPVEDARALPDAGEIPALCGRTFAAPSSKFQAAGGLDPLLFNEFELEALGLRLTAAGGTLRLLTSVELTHFRAPDGFEALDPIGARSALARLADTASRTDIDRYYSPAGLSLAHLRRPDRALASAGEVIDSESGDDRILPVVVRPRQTVLIDNRELPRLRWAIKTSSPAGPSGESWGDTHFARSLADALRELGQDVVIDAREASARPTDYFDDVTLVLRGLDSAVPPPGSLAYLWVISHPDMLKRSELARFDRVFAASLSWAQRTSQRWSLPVEPLLQCTDPSLFTPTGIQRGNEILFVGNSRGVPRPTVMEAVRAGIDFTLYGGDWERFVPAEAITADRVDNRDLGSMYSRASVVLNDHWSDMQREGFISNRLFDVVAAGGRALSDDVVGISQIFGGAVRTYGAVSEIAPLLRSDIDDLFPGDEEILEISHRIRQEHSFLARARVLLDAAVADLSPGAAQ